MHGTLKICGASIAPAFKVKKLKKSFINFAKVTQLRRGSVETSLTSEGLLNVDFSTMVFIPIEWQPFSLWLFPENPVESYSVVQIADRLALPTSGPVSQVHELHYLLAVGGCKAYIKGDESKILLGPVSWFLLGPCLCFLEPPWFPSDNEHDLSS